MSDRMDIRGAIGDGAARMSLPDLPQPEETQAILTGALRELEGIDTRLETWTADDQFTQFGKRLVVRYDLEARLAAAPNVRRYHWLGKFYDRDEDARRVASVLRELASFDGHAQSGLAFPSVLAYHAPRRLLLLTYESGESMTTAMAQDTEAILAAIGRALATLHSLPIAPTRILSPDAVLEDIRPRVRDLCDRFPSEAESLGSAFAALERDMPFLPSAPAFVHGDFGPANLLWRKGHVVVLDFDKCALGDPAADLGNLFAQLFRTTIKRPEILRDFASARATVLESYSRWSPADSRLDSRVAWYERATLLRKIHGLLFSKSRDQHPEAVRQRQAEAVQLMRMG